MQYIGVNLAGAEFGSPGQPYGVGYTYPTADEIAYEAQAGMTIIRLPFLWERIQPTLNGPLDPAELDRMRAVVTEAASQGLSVVLDVHDYGSYHGQLIGSPAVPTSAFADLWGRLAGAFAAAPNVLFGLMNEPQQPDAATWLTDANAAIAAIRAAGARQEVLVSGIGWDGAATFTANGNSAVLAPGIVDPAGNFAFEVHQYLDADASGTSAAVVSPTIGAERLAAVTQWAEAQHQRLFLGEFGTASDPTSLAALGNLLGAVAAHPDVWQGATYWAAGPWWGSYMYSAEPSGGRDTPQMQVLEQYAATATPPAVGSGSTAPPPVTNAPAPVPQLPTPVPAEPNPSEPAAPASPAPAPPAEPVAAGPVPADSAAPPPSSPALVPLPSGGAVVTATEGLDPGISAWHERIGADGTPVVDVWDHADGSHDVVGRADHLTIFAHYDAVITGGGRSEHFIFRPGWGAGLVTDFAAAGPGHDVISLPYGVAGSVDDVLAGAVMSHGHAVLDFGAMGSIALRGVSVADLIAHPEDIRLRG